MEAGLVDVEGTSEAAEKLAKVHLSLLTSMLMPDALEEGLDSLCAINKDVRKSELRGGKPPEKVE